MIDRAELERLVELCQTGKPHGLEHPAVQEVYKWFRANSAALLELVEDARNGRYTSGLPLNPTEEMIEAGAQRLVRWETGKETWPTSWSALDVMASRNDAERVWRSMWLEAVRAYDAAIDAKLKDVE